MKGPFYTIEDAEKEFTKKFTDKTKNKWEDREQFTPVPGKYTLLEMDDDDDDVSILKYYLQYAHMTAYVKYCQRTNITNFVLLLFFKFSHCQYIDGTLFHFAKVFLPNAQLNDFT